MGEVFSKRVPNKRKSGFLKDAAPHVICCGLLVVGSACGLRAWLADGGFAVVGLTTFIAVAAWILWRLKSRAVKTGTEPDRQSHDFSGPQG